MTSRVRLVYVCGCCIALCCAVLMAYVDVKWKCADAFAAYTVSIQIFKHVVVLLPILSTFACVSFVVSKSRSFIFVFLLPLFVLGVGAILMREVSAQQRLNRSPLSPVVASESVEEFSYSTDWYGDARWHFVIQGSEEEFSDFVSELGLEEVCLQSTIVFTMTFPERELPSELVIYENENVSACLDSTRRVYYVQVAGSRVRTRPLGTS